MAGCLHDEPGSAPSARPRRMRRLPAAAMRITSKPLPAAGGRADLIVPGPQGQAVAGEEILERPASGTLASGARSSSACGCGCRPSRSSRPRPCPRCGLDKTLDPATSRCVLCSRTCARCGHKIGRTGRTLCGECSRRERRQQGWQPCPRCAKPGRIRSDTRHGDHLAGAAAWWRVSR